MINNFILCLFQINEIWEEDKLFAIWFGIIDSPLILWTINLQPLQYRQKCILLVKDATQIDKDKTSHLFFFEEYLLAITKNIKNYFTKSHYHFLRISIKKNMTQILK